MEDELVVTHLKNSMNLNGQQLEIDAAVLWHIIEGEVKEVWDVPSVYAAKACDN